MARTPLFEHTLIHSGTDVMNKKPLDLFDPETVEHLFDVAGQLFAERGNDGVSIREISKAANVSVSAIYYHFQSKENLFAEVTLHRYEDFEIRLLRRIGIKTDPASVALAFYDCFVEDDTLLRLFQRDMIKGSPDNTHFLARHPYRHFRRIIDKILGFDREGTIGEMKSFSFAAIVNGYAELSMHDMGHVGEQRMQYLNRNRDFLEQFVKNAFRS